MSEPITIQSHKGPYTVHFDEQALADLDRSVASGLPNAHFIIDRKVAGLYEDQLKNVLAYKSVLLIDATEPNKSLDKFTGYVEHLVARKVRRGDCLIALGGGIMQDITSFLAATLLRGIDWKFYPTTLLAQADSCIGSKSSINVGEAKNLLGTFTPPVEIRICTGVLKTLDGRDIRSGVGEMLKVHAIAGPGRFDQIARDYERILGDRETMIRYIRESLLIKKGVIEKDEFDKGIRNVMNYGHSFGHAIESATDFAVPHGIGVTIGMDMANYVAMKLGMTERSHYERMHPALFANYRGFEKTPVPIDSFISAIAKDKKNQGDQLMLILPNEKAEIGRKAVPNDSRFRELCVEYLATARAK